jgi:hypothetical protein
MLGRSSPNRQLGSLITLGTSRVNTLGGGPASATSGGTNNKNVQTSCSDLNAVISSGEMYFQCKILKNGCYVSAYELSL